MENLLSYLPLQCIGDRNSIGVSSVGYFPSCAVATYRNIGGKEHSGGNHCSASVSVFQ